MGSVGIGKAFQSFWQQKALKMTNYSLKVHTSTCGHYADGISMEMTSSYQVWLNTRVLFRLHPNITLGEEQIDSLCECQHDAEGYFV